MSWLSTSGLARITARHPWRTILVWVVILAVFGWQASMIGGRTTSEFEFNTKPESVKGFDLIEQHMGGKQPLTEPVFYALLQNFLHALMQTGVAVCGGTVVQPLTGRTEAIGPRN